MTIDSFAKYAQQTTKAPVTVKQPNPTQVIVQFTAERLSANAIAHIVSCAHATRYYLSVLDGLLTLELRICKNSIKMARSEAKRMKELGISFQRSVSKVEMIDRPLEDILREYENFQPPKIDVEFP